MVSPGSDAHIKMDSTMKKTATMRTQKTKQIAGAGAVRDSFASTRIKHLQTESQVTLDANITAKLKLNMKGSTAVLGSQIDPTFAQTVKHKTTKKFADDKRSSG